MNKIIVTALFIVMASSMVIQSEITPTETSLSVEENDLEKPYYILINNNLCNQCEEAKQEKVMFAKNLPACRGCKESKIKRYPIQNIKPKKV